MSRGELIFFHCEFQTLIFGFSSIEADLRMRLEQIDKMDREFISWSEEAERSTNQMKEMYEKIEKECLKDPQFRQLKSMYAKEDGIDDQIASLENELKEELRRIDQLESHGQTLQEQLVQHQTLRQKLDELTSSNESRQKQLDEKEKVLEEAQKEAEAKATAEKKREEMLASNNNHHVQENVKDMEDIYNDSGLGTTTNALPGVTPEKEQPPTEAQMNKTLENLTRGGTPTGEELNVTLQNLTRDSAPRPELLSSTPAVMLGLRGLVDTSKVTRRILSSAQLPQESPIPRAMMGKPYPQQTTPENEKQSTSMR